MSFYLLSYLVLHFALSLSFLFILLVFIFILLGPSANPNSSRPNVQAQFSNSGPRNGLASQLEPNSRPKSPGPNLSKGHRLDAIQACLLAWSPASKPNCPNFGLLLPRASKASMPTFVPSSPGLPFPMRIDSHPEPCSRQCSMLACPRPSTIFPTYFAHAMHQKTPASSGPTDKPSGQASQLSAHPCGQLL